MKILFFKTNGSIELREVKFGEELLWSSDADDDFADEGFPDVLNPDDEDEIDDLCTFLIRIGELEEGEEIDIVCEEDEGDEDDDDDDDDDEPDPRTNHSGVIIDGEFERVK